ncbi:hypothetical protein QQS21_003614 [Conoideocrella luteorostrata]|uniref:AB hydrolase-1 domain-containing protein n=1 Tax=Conoideocrella luteorostrata TaxID=1105319 RepID=A0AAJ0FW84_9HYPO|nr:hypothetical protein QQS21_003614 [Conoideocrella luteorostrata]
MSVEKVAVVIIGGGWHTPESYAKLARGLGDAGYDVHRPGNPSMVNQRQGAFGLAEDTKSMRAYVTKLVEDGRRVIALAHSYGGQVASNSLTDLGWETRSRKRLPGGVIRIVFMCAFALLEGGSVIGQIKAMGDEALIPLALDFAEDMTVVCRDPAMQFIGDAGASKEETEAYLNTLHRWNGRCMYDAISQCSWRDIPVTYVYTKLDMTIPLDYQKSMVACLEGNGRPVESYELDTTHCPNLTATNEITEIIKKIAD